MPISIWALVIIMVNKTEKEACPPGAYILLKGEGKSKRKHVRIDTVTSATKSVSRDIGWRMMGDGREAWTLSVRVGEGRLGERLLSGEGGEWVFNEDLKNERKAALWRAKRRIFQGEPTVSEGFWRVRWGSGVFLVGKGVWKVVTLERWAGGTCCRALQVTVKSWGLVYLQKEVPGELRAWRLSALSFTISLMRSSNPHVVTNSQQKSLLGEPARLSLRGLGKAESCVTSWAWVQTATLSDWHVPWTLYWQTLPKRGVLLGSVPNQQTGIAVENIRDRTRVASWSTYLYSKCRAHHLSCAWKSWLHYFSGLKTKGLE